MVQAGIFREQTAEEKKDFQQIGTRTYQDHVRKHLISIEKKFTLAHLPFCYRCAKMDMMDKVETKMKETQRSESKIIEARATIDLELIDFEANYGENNFKLLGMVPVREDKLIDNIRTNMNTGQQYEYQCKRRGCKCSVFVPKKEHEKREKRQKSKSK